MTNKERQNRLDISKYLLSEELNDDMGGKLPHCSYCVYQMRYLNGAKKCAETQERKEAELLCAKAYNKMKKQKNNV